jgi:hypothetical protein
MKDMRTPKGQIGSQFDEMDFVFDGYEIVGDHHNSVAAPEGCDPRLKKYLLAAMKAYYLDYNSIDYVLKTFGKKWVYSTKKFPIRELISEILYTAKFCYSQVLQRRRHLCDLPDKFGLVAAGGALLRLESSFKASTFLIQHGLYFESMCIQKLILEQLAWVNRVYEIEDNSLYSFSPVKAISTLKNIMPNVGRLYAFINERAHLDTKMISQVVHVDKHGSYAVLSDLYRSLDAAIVLLTLADIFGIVMEKVYRDYFGTYEYVKIDGGEVGALRGRLSARLLRRLQKDAKDFQKGKYRRRIGASHIAEELDLPF